MCLCSRVNWLSIWVGLCFRRCQKALQSVARPWRAELRSAMQQPVLMPNRRPLWTILLSTSRQCCNAWRHMSLARPAGTLRKWARQSGTKHQHCKRWERMIHVGWYRFLRSEAPSRSSARKVPRRYRRWSWLCAETSRWWTRLRMICWCLARHEHR